MKLLGIEKVKDGKYLKSYELTYLNKKGREKKYEIVSRSEIAGPEDLGTSISGLSLVVLCADRLLLLKEFRMGINREIYNLCAGMIEPEERIEDCIARELYEETGAIDFEISPICIYSVIAPNNFNGIETFGKLFLADIHTFEKELSSEIEKITILDELPISWTYPEIQPKLLDEARRRGFLPELNEIK